MVRFFLSSDTESVLSAVMDFFTALDTYLAAITNGQPSEITAQAKTNLISASK